MQQNTTITRSVGYQGHFVDGAEVLQKALGAAEENNILTRSVGYQDNFVDGTDVVHQNLGAAEQEQERLVTRGVLSMVLRYYNGTLMQQNKTTR